MLLALPADAALCQHMVIAADAKSNAAVFVVREPGVFQWVEVQVDDVVQCPHRRLHRALQVGIVLHGKISEGEAGQIADHELAGAGDRHHHRIAVLRPHLGADMLNGRHILGDLRAEVGAVDHARMAVGVHAVDGVAVKCEGRAGFHRRAQHQPHDILDGDGALFDAGVTDAVQIPFLPLLAPIVLQRVALDGEDIVGTHEMPRRVKIFLRQFPEQIGIAHGRKHIVRLHAVVAVVGAQLQKLRKILVPRI